MGRDIGRRRLMETIGTAAAIGIAGCAGDPESDTTGGDDGGGGGGESSGTASGQMSKRGGTLRIGDQTSIQSLNVLVAEADIEYVYGFSTYDTLTQLKPDLTIGPRLATDWESNSDNTQWTFNLRDDVHFNHNDQQVVAEDVAATAEAIYAEESTAAGKGNLGPIDTVEAVDDTTVRFNLTSSDGSLPKRWSHQWSVIYPADVVSGSWGDEMDTKNFGSGPFVIESHEPSNKTVLKAVDDWWRTDDEGNQLPYLDKVELVTVPDTGTQVNQFMNKKLDTLIKPPRSQWNRFENTEAVNAMAQQGGRLSIINMRVDEPPFDDNRVRKAFKLAIDRTAVLEGSFNGLGDVANGHPVAKSFPTHSDLSEQLSQNRDEAERLLEEAGYGSTGDPIELEMVTTTSPQFVLDTSVIVTEQLNELPNVDIEITQQSYDTWISESWAKAQFHPSWYRQRPSAEKILKLVWHSEASWNETGWGDEDFDEALEQSIASQSIEEKREHIKTCQRILRDRGPTLFPYWGNTLGLTWDYMNDFELYPTQDHFRADRVYLSDEAPTK